MGCKITIKCALSNAETRADMLHRTRSGLVELERHLKRLGINGFPPPTFFCPVAVHWPVLPGSFPA